MLPWLPAPGDPEVKSESESGAGGAVFSNIKASPGGVGKGEDEGAQGLQGSLAHLKPGKKGAADAVLARSDPRLNRWLITRQLTVHHITSKQMYCFLRQSLGSK